MRSIDQMVTKTPRRELASQQLNKRTHAHGQKGIYIKNPVVRQKWLEKDANWLMNGGMCVILSTILRLYDSTISRLHDITASQ